MDKTSGKIPLQTETAWSHLRTLEHAKEVVNSWPDWMRNTVVFRDNSSSTVSSDAVPTKRIARRKSHSAGL
jgi:hypothetical protein